MDEATSNATRLRLRACHYATGQLVELLLQNGRIAAVTGLTAEPIDLTAGWVAPGVFDVQINGALGISFNAADLTAAQVGQVVARCHQHGISNFCPTLITAAFADLEHGFATLAQARAINPLLARVIPGFHLEGPWISAEDGPRGAHPRAHVRLPCWDEFRRLQDAAQGGIVLVTLAPELERVSCPSLSVWSLQTSSSPWAIQRPRGSKSARRSRRGHDWRHTWAMAVMPCCPAMTIRSGISSPRTLSLPV